MRKLKHKDVQYNSKWTVRPGRPMVISQQSGINVTRVESRGNFPSLEFSCVPYLPGELDLTFKIQLWSCDLLVKSSIKRDEHFFL
jgi:hypothetical protein